VSLKLADFECPKCGDVQELLYDNREELEVHCGECETKCDKLMGRPAIHTLETHMRGYQGRDYDRKCGAGHWSPASGEFIDENLCDRKTGQPLKYSSVREKEKLLAEQGLFAKGDTQTHRDTFTKRREKRPMYFSGVGKKTSQFE